MDKKIILMTLLCLLVIPFSGISQCMISNPSGNQNLVFGTGMPFGQSFLACQNGVITDLSLFLVGGVSTPLAGTLTFYEGSDASGLMLYSETITFTSFTGFSDFTLTSPIPVVNGIQYAFIFEPFSGSGFITQYLETPPRIDIIVGGFLIPSQEHGNEDLVFKLTIENVPEPIPTIGQWGLVLLGLLLLCIGTIRLFRLKELAI